jgi:threonine/homoserine/homoserine lactone efflux protein
VPEASTFALFVVAALALLLVPGPAVFYVVARSVEGGRATGLVSVLGVELGTLVHVVFAAIGLSAVLVSSATAFTVVKWLGAAYLVYLGLQHLLARDGDQDEELPAGGATRPSRVFTQSVLVQILNPKVALFFLAFLPQFVDPSRGAAWTQIIVLGATVAILGLFTDGLYALLGGAAGDWLKHRSAGAGPRRVRRYVIGRDLPGPRRGHRRLGLGQGLGGQAWTSASPPDQPPPACHRVNTKSRAGSGSPTRGPSTRTSCGRSPTSSTRRCSPRRRG